MATSSATPGLGDPYWYEWSVGQKYIVQLLDPTSGVASVTLQAFGVKGVDDVVVDFADGRCSYIQVKYSRVRKPLTFAALVSPESGDRPSLLKKLADGWQQAPTDGPRDAILHTN